MRNAFRILSAVPKIVAESCPHRLRLCHVRLRPLPHSNSNSGYGFTVRTDTERLGQFIDEVDSQSPAEAGGLRPGDRLVEVNGVNVETDSHHEVEAIVAANRSLR